MFDNFFGGLFDFNHDGKTSGIEAGIGFAIMQELLDEEDEDCEEFDCDVFADSEGFEAEDLVTLQEKLDELNDRLIDLELDEPSIYSRAHDHWESRRDELVDQIQELEDQITALE